jgi:16S rRNA processing protein RimM
MTVRVGSEAQLWERTRRFTLERDGRAETHEAESVQAYRDRLVLKLRGIDDAGSAAAWRGARVSVAREDAPALGAGRHYVAALIGLEVVTTDGRGLGVVEHVVPTGGADLLQVRRAGDSQEPLLIPMAEEIVRNVDPARGRIEVDLPEGLEDLNP